MSKARKGRRIGHEETGEDLRRKGEWFGGGRVVGLDVNIGLTRSAAIAQARLLGTLDHSKRGDTP